MWGPWDLLLQTHYPGRNPRYSRGCSVHRGAAHARSDSGTSSSWPGSGTRLSDAPHGGPRNHRHIRLSGHSLVLSALLCLAPDGVQQGAEPEGSAHPEVGRWRKRDSKWAAAAGCRGVAWGKHEAGAPQDPEDIARGRSPRIPVQSQARALSWRKQMSAGPGGGGLRLRGCREERGPLPLSRGQSVGWRKPLQKRGQSHPSLSGYGADWCSMGLGGQTEVRTRPARGDRSRPLRLRSSPARVCRTLCLGSKGCEDTGDVPGQGWAPEIPPGLACAA